MIMPFIAYYFAVLHDGMTGVLAYRFIHTASGTSSCVVISVHHQDYGNMGTA